MLAIKLQRKGKKHQPSYRLVVAERRSKMAGPPIEDIGFYNPFSKALLVKKDRVEYWIKNGAQPTVTAHNLLVKASAIQAPTIVVKMKKPVDSARTSSEPQPNSSPQEAKLVEESAVAPQEAAVPEQPAAEAVSVIDSAEKQS